MRHDTRWDEWDVWTGIECEGMHVGLNTTFVGPNASLATVKEIADKVNRLYVNGGWIERNGWDALREVLEAKRGKYVPTIALTAEQATEIPADIDQTVHVIVAITVPDISGRKISDELRLDYGPLSTITFTWWDGRTSQPADYRADTVIETEP